MRADARRNRQRIVEAATTTFAAEGIGVPVDVIAERAGVGIGTLYRHFPTKEALFEAIVLDRIDSMLARATAPSGEGDAADHFFAFLTAMATEVSSKRDLMEAMAQAGFDVKTRSHNKFDQLRAAIDAMRQRAVDQGTVRGDVGTDEVLSLVIGVCMGSERSGGCPAAPLVRVVCDGLRTRR